MDPASNRRSEEVLIIIKKTNCPGCSVQSGWLRAISGILCAREIRYEARLGIGPCFPALPAKVGGRGTRGGSADLPGKGKQGQPVELPGHFRFFRSKQGERWGVHFRKELSLAQLGHPLDCCKSGALHWGLGCSLGCEWRLERWERSASRIWMRMGKSRSGI